MIRVEQYQFPEDYSLKRKMQQKRKVRHQNEVFAEMLDVEMKKLDANVFPDTDIQPHDGH